MVNDKWLVIAIASGAPLLVNFKRRRQQQTTNNKPQTF
jgi:hypothetical protein